MHCVIYLHTHTHTHTYTHDCCRQEDVYDAEEVFGRDIKSVFPTESKRALLESDAAKAILEKGSKKFISESELAEITAASKSRHGSSGEEQASNKPLAQILLDQRAEKEARFQEQWKQMKIGKNRPLDEDELQFLDGLFKAEAEEVRRKAQEEQVEVEEFQKLRAKMLKSNGVDEVQRPVRRDGSGKLGREDSSAGQRQASRPHGPTSKPRLVVKAKHSLVEKEENLGCQKRQKTELTSPASQGGQEGSAIGLAGLLGDYASDSEA